MAWGVFTFSNEGRARLAGVLRALLIAQLVVSLCMVIFCYNASMKVMLLLKQIHKVTVYLLYGLILFQAYGMKLHYTGGLRLITLLLQTPYWPRVSAASRVWLFTGALLPLNGILVYAACRATMKALMKELSSSLRIGISQYLTEPTWKRIIDTMQIELSCCGADKPNDWHEIPWINMDFLNEDSELVLSLAGADGKVLPPVSPYSCCTPRVLEPCYHDPLQQGAWGAAGVGVSWRHARGCVEAVRRPLQTAAEGLRCLAALLLILEAVILCLSRLLISSAAAAALRGDTRGPGRGFLYRGERATPLEDIEGPRSSGEGLERPRSSGESLGRPRPASAVALALPRRPARGHRRKRVTRGGSFPILSYD